MKLLGYKQQPQQTYYYCGPAAVSQALALMGISRTQTSNAALLKTTTAGTAWSGVQASYYAANVGPTSRPVPDIMGWYMQQAGKSGRYYAVDLSYAPTSTEATNFRARVVADSTSGYPVIGNAWESPNGPHLAGHPLNQEIFHFYTIHGYDNGDGTIFVTDSASGSPAIPWSSSVPKYSRVPTMKLTTINGGRGYVW